MADKEQINDEYQFSELDAMDGDDTSEGVVSEDKFDTPNQPSPDSEKSNIRRIFLIFVPLMIVSIVLYKVVDAYFLEKKPTESITPSTIATPPPPPVALTPSQPVMQPAIQSSISDPKVTEKLASLDQAQQSVRTDVATMNDELSGVVKNVDVMVAKMVELNAIITNLSMKVEEQSHRLEQITMQLKPKKVPHAKHPMTERVVYYIQAAIPGRAWLMASDGSTLTVSSGVTIPGYGIVRVIDANQGRVTTSSGQVIRFSRDDR